MSKRAWFYFVCVCLLWGIPYFFIKVALLELTPLAVAFGRIAIGAVVLSPIAVQAGLVSIIRRQPVQVAVLAIAEVAVPFTLIPAGEQGIPSSLAAILIASEPLMIVVLAFWLDHSESVGKTRFFGLLLGLIGVAVMVGLGRNLGASMAGASLVLLATLCYSLGTLLLKRWFAGASPVAVVAATLWVSTVVLAAPALRTVQPMAPSVSTVLALLILGIGCTGLGLLCFFTLIGLVGAGRAAVITYVAPAVATLLGVGVAGEPFTAATAAGFALILLGSWLATAKGSPFRRRRSARRNLPSS